MSLLALFLVPSILSSSHVMLCVVRGVVRRLVCAPRMF